jgi:Resolvase, N terminal domain
MIKSELGMRVYFALHRGYDTNGDQLPVHAGCSGSSAGHCEHFSTTCLPRGLPSESRFRATASLVVQWSRTAWTALTHGMVGPLLLAGHAGRSLREVLETVEMLKQQGTAFLSLEERIDTTSAVWELIFHVFVATAHFERRFIAERTRDGLQAPAAKRRRPGRPQLDEETLSSAFALIEAGLPPAGAARQVGVGRSTVSHIMAERTVSCNAEPDALLSQSRTVNCIQCGGLALAASSLLANSSFPARTRFHCRFRGCSEIMLQVVECYANSSNYTWRVILTCFSLTC